MEGAVFFSIISRAGQGESPLSRGAEIEFFRGYFGGPVGHLFRSPRGPLKKVVEPPPGVSPPSPPFFPGPF